VPLAGSFALKPTRTFSSGSLMIRSMETKGAWRTIKENSSFLRKRGASFSLCFVSLLSNS
jgi:hypothetical protein